MKAITIEQAIDMDFIGNPKVHTNVINGLKTVSVLYMEYKDNGERVPMREIYNLK